MSLYVWGSNKLKQLNTLKELHCYTPGFIPSTCGDNVPTVVAAGENHTLILCESGDVYAFGRGSEGQLGNGNADAAAEANIVSGLNEETIVDIAAGSASSYAVTSTGNVYQWGVVYRKMRDVGSRNDGLHGLAQDQDNTIVEVDTATRLLEHNGDTEPVGHGPRQLRDIVQDSTEKWQLPTAEADFDYLNELRSIGYSPNEMKARMTERRREHQDMILAGCTRGPQLIPSKIPNIEHIRVRAIAAGYSHVMLLTDEGRLYGAGYNDRGQLGLGHRINTSDFKPLDFLANKFVLEVACGYQHCICRAIDREQLQAMASAGENTDEVVVGSSFGADVYVWGNGTLGQLGLGLKGTTKGSLFPTRNVALHNQFPLGIVSISAGENFTAVVTTNGKVFSFGHSEYNQHGNRTGQGHDYVSAHYYFLPREVSIEKPANATSWKKRGTEQGVEASASAVVRIKRISCGAAFTVAIDDAGDLYSWGWNESGVLGHGIRHFGATPQRVDGVGATFDGCRLRSVSTGSKHVVALTEAQGHAWANSFHSILEAEKQVDCIIDIDDSLGGALASKFGRNTKKSFPCHRAILSARSPYLRGYINTAVHEMLSHAGDEDMPIVIHLTLPSAHANAITVKSLLDYLYLDRVQISAHKRPELARLAADLGIARLHTILTTEGHGGPTVVPSFFTENLAQLFNSPENADIVFVYPRAVGGGRDLKSSAGDGDCVQPFDETHFDCVIYAHRAVIGSRLPYFEALLSGGFSESHNNVIITAPYSGPRSRATQIDVSGLELEGIDRQVLEMVLLYAYTGQFRVPAQTPDDCANRSINNSNNEVDLNEIMSILVAANRLGFTTLLQHCERLLSLHLGDFFPHNARNCLDFATAYNIPRLERQCREILAKANHEIAEVETGPVKG